jgi:hypothetical protein
MKDPYEVLRKKEEEVQRVKIEIEALRIVAELLGDESVSATNKKIDFKKAVDMS